MYRAGINRLQPGDILHNDTLSQKIHDSKIINPIIWIFLNPKFQVQIRIKLAHLERVKRNRFHK